MLITAALNGYSNLSLLIFFATIYPHTNLGSSEGISLTSIISQEKGLGIGILSKK